MQFYQIWLCIAIGNHIVIGPSMTRTRANPNLPPIPTQLLWGLVLHTQRLTTWAGLAYQPIGRCGPYRQNRYIRIKNHYSWSVGTPQKRGLLRKLAYIIKKMDYSFTIFFFLVPRDSKNWCCTNRSLSDLWATVDIPCRLRIPGQGCEW